MKNFFLLSFLALIVLISAKGKNLVIETLHEPENCNRETKHKDILKVHYTGILADTDVEFDSSKGKDPYEFQIGVGETIKGWDQGLLNMCVKEKRLLTVPPNLGYGEKGLGDKVPGGATLKFEVELLSISNEPKPNDIFEGIDTDDDGVLSQDEVMTWVFKEAQLNEDAFEDAARLTRNVQYLREYVEEIIRDEDYDNDGAISLGEFLSSYRDIEEEMLKDNLVSTKYKNRHLVENDTIIEDFDSDRNDTKVEL